MRAPEPQDAPAVFAVVAAQDTAELGAVDYELADAEAELTQPGLNLATDAWLATAAGAPLGYASVLAGSGADTVHVELAVHPAAPAQVGAALLARIRARCAELAAAGNRSVVVATAGAPATPDSSAAERLRADGWHAVRRFHRMRIDLAADEPAAQPPPGVRLHRGAAVSARAVHAVLTAAFAEHFGSQPESFPAWRARQEARAGYDRDLWWLAEVAGEPAAALVGLRMADLGFIARLGVLGEHRGAGLGRLLLRSAFARFAALGYRRAELGVDSANTTGALRLYESVGMSLAFATDVYQLAVPARG